ncbi:MAG TPA: chalcone isomerase family protein [Spirochaetota bacterium]|nr:chalcone isomerase family protein [Spirochaetota bacterium]HPF05897.1 chalcone isomerase family protein [Spirochaetota bacterium]HPJ42436.1 chalcone isomerase family protein [Spirochaetota bacterium]HPR37630.1 chalcone isomerase family protein [Spirochaetota bacterium]HRX46775.1 chalcone isomerase family protein [Spirochaetota bacterium]
MKKSTIVKGSMAALLAVLLALPLFSAKLGGKEVVANGSGSRTKFGMHLYNASLFVPQEMKGASESDIINKDEPMSIYISITSGMISKEKFVDAVSDGFDSAAKSGYSANKQDYLNLYNNVTISKGDSFNNYYIPGKGLTVTHNNKTLGVIPGVQMKKAFFAIFIGSKPVQASLKKGMLGK